ncbi:MAG: AtpZ/AtpI family protein [Actinomycetota bacterium]|nr:AtpZ/AtpI family protein [Actinomycetota bacterium]
MNPSSSGSAPGRSAVRAPRVPVASAHDDGWLMAIELVTATLTWGGIGWLVDRWLGTAPVLMSIGFVVGNFAGIYLLWLKTSRAPDAGPSADTTAGGRGEER